MKARMKLGDFLVAYLRRIGVRHVFGLPGDLVLGLFHRLTGDSKLDVVTFSHEPAVGFSADGYARSTRRIGVLCVTYGAGAHNVINAVAAAYAEQIPLLVLSGGPGEAEATTSSIHHQVKDVEAQCRIFREVTCRAEIVGHGERAASQIADLIDGVRSERRPGYLEIHRDRVEEQIPVPESLRGAARSAPRRRSDPRKLREAVGEIGERLASARRPVLIAGVEVFRAGAESALRRLAERLEVPVATTMLGKGAFPMDHPLQLGVYMGPVGHADIRARVRSSDLVLSLGTQLTDLNLGARKPEIPREHAVWAVDGHVNVSLHRYTDVELADLIRSLARADLPSFRQRVAYRDNLDRNAGRRRPSNAVAVNDLLLVLNDFLEAHPGYHVVAESGDMLFGGLELRLHGKGVYMAQGYYASMGFGVPAALGAEIGTGRRSLVLCGDGAFQMTGAEISHAPGRGLRPIVVVVNNGGWGIFRPVTPHREVLEIPDWPYASMAEGWGGNAASVSDPIALREALEAAHGADRFSLIDCRVPEDDLSPIGRSYIQGSARRGR